ncbi:MAG: hypothetical protein ACI3ZD_03595 [Prevotella sp.]
MIRFLLIAITSLLLSSCRTHTTAISDSSSLSSHRDTVFVARERVDSVFLRDSIFVSQAVRGDTVFIEKTSLRTLTRERTKTDTIYRTRNDTVFSSTSYERTEEKESVPLKLYLALAAMVFLTIIYIYIETRKK